ncbi:DoxX family protein [Glaciecola sp. 1036]|uniref:DoxX family protein n=1 Tax=Alteromonadaceae TaxID=72275 RepID=UPI003D083B67
MKTLINNILKTNSSISPLVLRAPIGLVLAAHGAQKLFAWFGGYGLEGTGQYMASLGLNPGYLMALLAGSAEFFGGLALVLGVLTRPAAALTAFTMLIAIFTAHIGNGLFLSNDGYEYALVLLVATLSLLITGGGRFSIDKLIVGNSAKA